MLYRILKVIIGLGLRLYYREVRVKNRKALDQNGPTIIISNHPNTIMDAWIIGHFCKQEVYYLAKGTFFNTSLKRYFLKSLNLIPINRPVDAATKGVSNAQSFEECYKVLEQGKTLVIFPEGNSIMERQLRELKTGTARIALEVERRNKGNLNLKVLPVGLFYSEAERFRSSLLANVGAPILVSNFLEDYETDPVKTSRELTNVFRNGLEEVLVSSSSKELEILVDEVADILFSADRIALKEKVELTKRVQKQLEQFSLKQPELLEDVQLYVNSFRWQAEQLEVKTKFMKQSMFTGRSSTHLVLSLFNYIIGFPAFLFGLVHNIIPFKLTSVLVTRMVDNIEYYAPVNILMGFVLYPLNYFGFYQLFMFLFEPSTLGKFIYFFLMPATGIYAFHFAHFLGSISFRLKATFFFTDEKSALKNMLGIKENLSKLILNAE